MAYLPPVKIVITLSGPSVWGSPFADVNLSEEDEILTGVRTALEKLVTNGGETVEGVATELEHRGVQGQPRSTLHCVLAEYLSEAVPEGWDVAVFPSEYGSPGSVRIRTKDHGREGVVPLPPVLNDLAVRFDRNQLPELEKPHPAGATFTGATFTGNGIVMDEIAHCTWSATGGSFTFTTNTMLSVT
jgi:hypothetical protein